VGGRRGQMALGAWQQQWHYLITGQQWSQPFPLAHFFTFPHLLRFESRKNFKNGQFLLVGGLGSRPCQ